MYCKSMKFACWVYHVSGLLAISVARDEVGEALYGSAKGGLAPSHRGQAMCDGLGTAINFLSFFPCLNASAPVAAKDCDVFAYPAALLAAEHVNSHPSILKFPELGFNTSLRLVERETMVWAPIY